MNKEDKAKQAAEKKATAIKDLKVIVCDLFTQREKLQGAVQKTINLLNEHLNKLAQLEGK